MVACEMRRQSSEPRACQSHRLHSSVCWALTAWSLGVVSSSDVLFLRPLPKQHLSVLVTCVILVEGAVFAVGTATTVKWDLGRLSVGWKENYELLRAIFSLLCVFCEDITTTTLGYRFKFYFYFFLTGSWQTEILIPVMWLSQIPYAGWVSISAIRKVGWWPGLSNILLHLGSVTLPCIAVCWPFSLHPAGEAVGWCH